MKVMLVASLWGMILGYWVLYHGVTVLQSIGQTSASGSGNGGPNPDEGAWLSMQPIIEGLA